MAESTILNIPEIEETQNNKHVTHNNAVGFLEQASNAKLGVSTAGTADITLTDDQATRYVYYLVGAGTASGAHNLVFPGEIGTLNNNAKRYFVVKNSSGYTVTVKSDAAGTTVVLATGAAAIIHQDHDDMVKLSGYDGLTTAPYDIACSMPGLPDDNGEVLKFVAVRAIDFPDDFAGSVGHCGTNPTATAAYDVKKNGSSIGSISISTSGVFTFSTTGGATSLAISDRITINAPSPQDATLANVGISLLGTRTL